MFHDGGVGWLMMVGLLLAWRKMVLVGGLEHGFYFPFHIWDVILSNLTFIFFRGVGQPPTSISIFGGGHFFLVEVCNNYGSIHTMPINPLLHHVACWNDQNWAFYYVYSNPQKDRTKKVIRYLYLFSVGFDFYISFFWDDSTGRASTARPKEPRGSDCLLQHAEVGRQRRQEPCRFTVAPWRCRGAEVSHDSKDDGKIWESW